ncbi:MAG TPA: MFS transporter [Streptosporangiaceae bacterium]
MRLRWLDLGLLRDRDYLLYWAGETVSGAGSAMAVVAMPLTAVLVLHAGAFEVGMLQATAWLPSLLVGLPAGAWVDRMRKRPVLVTADIVSLALFASVPFAAWSGVLTVWQLVAVAFGGGAAQVFFSAANPSFLRSVVKEENRGEARAKMEAGSWAGELVAPGLAGLAAQLLGAATGLLVNAISFAASALCLVRVHTVEPETAPAAKQRSSLRQDIIQGLMFLLRDPYLRVVAFYAGAANFAECIMDAVLVVFLVRTVGVGAGVAGLLMAAPGVGGLIGSLLATRIGRWVGTARGYLLSAALASPCVLLLPLTFRDFGISLFAVGMPLYAIGVAVSNVLGQTFTINYVPDHLLGRFSSTLGLVIRGTQPLGAAIGAVIGGAASPRAAMWTGTIGITLSAGIMFIGPIRKRRDLPVAYPVTEAEAVA